MCNKLCEKLHKLKESIKCRCVYLDIIYIFQIDFSVDFDNCLHSAIDASL
jgi:hypothetical protein